MGNWFSWNYEDAETEVNPKIQPRRMYYLNTPAKRRIEEGRFAEAIDHHRRVRGIDAGVSQKILIEGNPTYAPTNSTKAPGTGFFPVGVGHIPPNEHKVKVVDMLRYFTAQRLRTTDNNFRVTIPLGAQQHAPVLVSYKERERRNLGPTIADAEHPLQPNHPSYPHYGQFGGEVYSRR